MTNDPRLADPVILALAALRAKKNHRDAPRRTVTCQVIYAAGLDPILEPEILGECYTYELPREPGDRPW
jgi:hypothetical protein